MKIPSKKELLELQRRYRTDKKIGEILGGVPEYLIAYWRRKKGIAAFSSPKYGKKQILEMWERYGRDVPAGDAMGITGNAFRYWRNKYGITEKPVRLKLEQIQLPLPGMDLRTGKKRKMSYLHRIISNKISKSSLRAGEEVLIEPDKICLESNNGDLGELLKQNGMKSIKNPQRVLIHHKGSVGRNGKKGGIFDLLAAYAKSNMPNDGGQIYNDISKGHILPGDFIIGSDKGVIGAGAVGALGVCSSKQSLTSALSLGTIKLPVFDVVRIMLLDTPPDAVEPLDVIFNLKSDTEAGQIANKAVEFTGVPVVGYSIEKRFQLCYLSGILNCLTAGIAGDKGIERLLRRKALVKFNSIRTDVGAHYSSTWRKSVLEMEPMLCILEKGQLRYEPVTANTNKPVRTVVAGFYSGGMHDDIADIVSVIGKKRCSGEVRAFIRPATSGILLKLVDDSYFKQLVGAGFSILHPSPSVFDFEFPQLRPEFGPVMFTDPAALDHIPADYPFPVYIANHLVAASTSVRGMISDPRDRI